MTSATKKVSSNRHLVLQGAPLRSWDASSKLEWLVTNGMGGYASGTLSGANTRRYHGCLVAALIPPVGRTLLVARLEETITVGGQAYQLSSNQWWDESISPRGYENLERFELEDGIPVFYYRVGSHLLEKRIWMESGENLTWVSYSWPDGAPGTVLSVRLFMGYRDFHWSQHGSSDWHWRSGTTNEGLWVSPGDPGQRIVVKASPLSRYVPENVWYYGFLHNVERFRGLDNVEDLWVPGSVEITLFGGTSVGLLVSAGDTTRSAAECHDALDRERKRRSDLLSRVRMPLSNEAEVTLAAASDTFLVRRPMDGKTLPTSANTVIAGYHWFGDWGRDTMISLPGLAITMGRLAEAKEILTAYSAFVSEGMLPNRFPDSGAAPEYNTVDATLWYFQAVHRYLKASGDRSLLSQLYPCLKEIINWHFKGTRHGIQVDPMDGLLRAGVSGSQLTWMDAKVGDWVVTPRVGKPVEIAALWYNALKLMAGWARECGDDGSRYAEAAARAADSFGKRYWIEDAGYLYDVIDGPDGDDRSFRPNQLFAISLPHSLLSQEKARMVVDACERRLLTPAGLRSLDPADPRYVGFYRGNQWQRDGAYHQGTVWGWLIGPYVDALLYAYNDREKAQAAVEPLLQQVRQSGVGTISEIFDGNPPYDAKGCIAQAWSVAETLRVLENIKSL